MSKVIPLYADDETLKRACEWVAKMTRGDMSDKERDELHRWLAESPDHEKMLLKASDTWDELDELSELSGMFPIDKVEEANNVAENDQHGFWQRPVFMPAFATVLIAVVSIGLWGFLYTGEEPAEIGIQGRITTGIGNYKTTDLVDGTRVMLNTDTQISANYSDKDEDRRVFLERGEAHFDVVSDPARPFIVVVGEKEFRAVGTAFNVQLMPEGVELIVTEGIVEVKFPIMRPSESIDSKYSLKQVVAGQMLIVDDEVTLIDDAGKRVIDKNLSWQQGKLQFDGEPLKQVVNELSRYSTYEFIFADKSAENIPVGGYFDIGNIDELLSVLDEGFGVDVRVDASNQVYISLAQ